MSTDELIHTLRIAAEDAKGNIALHMLLVMAADKLQKYLDEKYS